MYDRENYIYNKADIPEKIQAIRPLVALHKYLTGMNKCPTAFREVSDALVQYRRTREIRTQQELLVAALRDASRISHLRFEGGVDTLLNALVADSSLFSAELSLAQTRLNELLSLVKLYKALGGGWQA